MCGVAAARATAASETNPKPMRKTTRLAKAESRNGRTWTSGRMHQDCHSSYRRLTTGKLSVRAGATVAAECVIEAVRRDHKGAAGQRNQYLRHVRRQTITPVGAGEDEHHSRRNRETHALARVALIAFHQRNRP